MNCRKIFLMGLVVFCSLNTLYASELEGTWITDCIKNEQGYQRETMVNSGNNSAWKMEMAQEGDCKSMLDVDIAVSFQIGPNSQMSPMAKEFDMILSKAILTPKEAQVVQYLNMLKFCGISNWKINQGQEIQGLVCGDKTMPKTGDPTYDLAMISGNQFYRGQFSEEFNGSTQEKRPQALNMEQPYMKQ